MARSLFETRSETAGFWDRLKTHVPGRMEDQFASGQTPEAARLDARGRRSLIASVLVAGMGGR